MDWKLVLIKPYKVERGFLPSNVSKPTVDTKIEETPAVPHISLINISLPAPTVEAAGKNTILGCVRVLTNKLVVIVGGNTDAAIYFL